MELTSYVGPGVLAVADELADLYAAVFAAPPWNQSAEDLASFRSRLVEDVRRPGFRAVVGGADGPRRRTGVVGHWSVCCQGPGDIASPERDVRRRVGP